MRPEPRFIRQLYPPKPARGSVQSDQIRYLNRQGVFPIGRKGVPVIADEKPENQVHRDPFLTIVYDEKVFHLGFSVLAIQDDDWNRVVSEGFVLRCCLFKAGYSVLTVNKP